MFVFLSQMVVLDSGDWKLYLAQKGLGGGKDERDLPAWGKLLNNIKALVDKSLFVHKQTEKDTTSEYVQPKLFISYAWESGDALAKLQRWLLALTQDLEVLGVSVFLDINDMTGAIEGCMRQNLEQGDIILTINTPKYRERALCVPKSNLGFECDLTLERIAHDNANNKPISVFSLHYSGDEAEVYTGDEKLAVLSTLVRHDCRLQENYGEHLIGICVPVCTSHIHIDNFVGASIKKKGIFLTIYNTICSIDLSKNEQYMSLIEQWRLQKVNNISKVNRISNFCGRVDLLEEIDQKLKVCGFSVKACGLS